MEDSREWIASKPTVNVIALTEILRTNESVALQVGFYVISRGKVEIQPAFFGRRRGATHEDTEREKHGEELQIKCSPMQWNLRL